MDNKQQNMRDSFMQGLQGQLLLAARNHQRLWVANGGDAGVLLPLHEFEVELTDSGAKIDVLPIGDIKAKGKPKKVSNMALNDV